jgi:hypothetical protein
MTYHKRTTGDLLRQVLREHQKIINTSIPGYLVSFEPTSQLAQLQIGIKRVDTEGKSSQAPVIIECPVHFPGGQFSVEYELAQGDEGLIVFSQRCIDSWIDTGGVAENPILRLHDINDAMFIPGVRSEKNAMSNFQNNGIRLRNADGTQFIWLKNDGTGEITLSSLTINADTTINGTVNSTGDMTTDGDIIAQDGQFNAANFNAHVHPAGTPPGNTGTPQ